MRLKGAVHLVELASMVNSLYEEHNRVHRSLWGQELFRSEGIRPRSAPVVISPLLASVDIHCEP